MLTFHHILFYYVGPSVYHSSSNDRAALWIASIGSVSELPTEVRSALPEELPQGPISHYFYSLTTNSFIVVVASSAAFDWQ
ncbi:hypothetical protein [Eleftheria terrae]|uniref:hypothetical protein n=1 Tax=Eleftheria terrae TaxID=1597781 RepID=UPI00263B06EC|nr:hypothetical protein [Eleftheria terrae]WKB50730.1 hypothetical protein N7L95_12935 [Eleftheria terrae]